MTPDSSSKYLAPVCAFTIIPSGHNGHRLKYNPVSKKKLIPSAVEDKRRTETTAKSHSSIYNLSKYHTRCKYDSDASAKYFR